MIGSLPQSIEIQGVDYSIRTDYRDALTIFVAMNDPDLTATDKWKVTCEILYIGFDDIPAEYIQEACEKASLFLDGGTKYEDDNRPKLMDWEQDEQFIFSAVNKVAGREVRSDNYLHWWTFLGYFREIGEGMFTTILGIRQKRVKGKKLEKYEQEFVNSHKDMIDLKTKYTQEEQEEIEYYENLLR